MMLESLRDMGITIDVYASDGKNLTEAQQWQPMNIAEAVVQAKLAAESEPDANRVEVSVDLGDEYGWKMVWCGDYITNKNGDRWVYRC